MDASQGGGTAGQAPCPSWCVRRHGVVQGEDDWVHVGSPLAVGGALMIRLCSSADPTTGAVDGPFVLVGPYELTVSHARALGQALVTLADNFTPHGPDDDSDSTEPVGAATTLPRQGSGPQDGPLVGLHPSYGESGSG